MVDGRDNIVVSQKVWVNIKPRRPSVLPLKQHCPTCCGRLNTLKPTMLGNVVPTCCVRLHGPSHTGI